jgi:uroporphyrin-III C-methyltransferase/precorrin-2 dehydrogenase/sirohydrochlorin ferrochelatase/uroporphyrin-III C-methyltransferase
VTRLDTAKDGPGAPTVHLVGAGPGDPDLLTIKALRLLRVAEVVVYDRLVSQAVLDLIPAGTARIYAGKALGHHPHPQDETNELLVKLARTGHRVVRLKGGDPLVFGRGSEEALHLARHGVACEIVPGVTAASGCGASAGIPLTHRGLATSVRFVTGHCREDQPLDLNWQSLADPDTTLVVYMGLAHLAEIACRLSEAGLPADTPAAAIANGTLADERLLLGTLATLPDQVQQASLDAPVLIVIGRVVEVVEELRARRRAAESRAPDAGQDVGRNSSLARNA